MAIFTDLPFEIHHAIFIQLDLSSQLQFRTINKYMAYFLQYVRLTKQIIVSNDDRNNFYYNLLTNIMVGQLLDVYPRYLTHLTFGTYFDHDIKGQIPPSVTHLTFGHCFNKDIKDCIPNNVIHLVFGYHFNHSIKNIPMSITHLTLGYYFESELIFPSSITHLTIDRITDKIIPQSVTHLTLGRNVISASNYHEKITRLTVMIRNLPSNVTYLKLEFTRIAPVKQYIYYVLPFTITHLEY